MANPCVFRRGTVLRLPLQPNFWIQREGVTAVVLQFLDCSYPPGSEVGVGLQLNSTSDSGLQSPLPPKDQKLGVGLQLYLTSNSELQSLPAPTIRSWSWTAVELNFRFWTAVTPPRIRSWSCTAVVLNFKFWTAVPPPQIWSWSSPAVKLNFRFCVKE